MTVSGVWRGALDCCAKKTHHPLWTVLVDSFAPEDQTQPWRSCSFAALDALSRDGEDESGKLSNIGK